MDARHIKDVMTQALNKGNWMVYNIYAPKENKEFYFFSSKNDAKEFCINNVSDQDRWSVCYIKLSMHLRDRIRENPKVFEQLLLKNFKMNEQNISFLKENIKYMGFGEKLNADLEQKIKEGKPEFQLLFQTSLNQKPFEATLNFRKSDNSDMYFFNSYHAKLEKNNNLSSEQTFYINKAKGVTAKEAFNLLDGRAVFKELTNKEEQSYNAWLQLDFKNQDKHGNHIVKQYHENYGYDLAKSLSSLPVKELQNDTQRIDLIKSVEKGNIQSVTLERNGKPEKAFIEANPQYKTINIYDGQMNRVKKEDLFNNQMEAKSPPKGKQAPETAENVNGKDVHKGKEIKIKEEKTKASKEANADSLLPKRRTNNKKGLHP